MDHVFAALGHPARLWILRYLASHGPTRQTDLAKALAESGIGSATVNDGATSQLVRPLLNAGLVFRDRPRGPLQLRYEEQTMRLLTTASALAVAIASHSRDAADTNHAELMRAFTTAVDGLGEARVQPLPPDEAGSR